VVVFCPPEAKKVGPACCFPGPVAVAASTDGQE
jgi:hypothetical protein